MRIKENGFTLIELAIALMVIGLLIGGVLKGQELIENARLTKVLNQVKAYETALAIFRNTYGSLPGDMSNPGSRVPNCTGACAVAGDANRRIYPDAGHVQALNGNIHFFASLCAAYALRPYCETQNFWRQMQVAGLISNAVTLTHATSSPFAFGVEFPASPIEGTGFVAHYNIVNHARYGGMRRGHSITLTSSQTYVGAVKGRQAAFLDRKVDDGNPFSGTVLSDSGGGCATSATAGAPYNETSANARCDLFFFIE